jgi:hypothetical protein
MSSAEKTYGDWANYHATMFGFIPEREAAMLALWCEHFADEGFAVTELFAASKQLASSGASQWRADHLRALVDAVRRQRDTQRAEQAAPKDTCVLCASTGYVSVVSPYTLTVRGARFYRCVVTCTCALGRWKQANAKDKYRLPRLSGDWRWLKSGTREDVPLLTLAEYEGLFPDWRMELLLREKAIASGLQAVNAAQFSDSRFGRVPAKRIVAEISKLIGEVNGGLPCTEEIG